MYVLTWRSGKVRAFGASAPGSILIRGNTFLWGDLFSCHFFFQIIISSQNILQDLNFLWL